ncbi:Bug family tripartite tricarboxylate transporter substrate binding protein [Roseateles flavus]|uniref:Tripartite tricarboxylate transporter substrate binding protein BugE n=1 Tax=Roseateles flavus TaxID=3149041 RepID=A0ABV0GGD0_9BURK
MRLSNLLWAVAMVVPMSNAAWAQAWPTRPINWIVPFPPGGTTDVVARIVADRLGRELGQPVTVDNKAGAGGSIGTMQLMRATADGYTIGMATVSTHAVNPACNPKLGYDPLTDFVPVSNLARTANVLTVNNAFPAKTYAEFISLVKAGPGKYSYASTGHCGGMHMMGEMFKVFTRTAIVHIPYRGAGPALNDLLGGQVQIMFDNLPSSIGHIKAGSIRALAVASEQRIPGMSGVPTFKELRLPEVNEPAWYGVVVPARTPAAVVQRLSEALRKVLLVPEVRTKLQDSGAEPVGNSPEAFAVEISAELEKMRRVVKQQQIRFDQ